MGQPRPRPHGPHRPRRRQDLDHPHNPTPPDLGPTRHAWTEAENLSTGDTLRTDNGTTVTVAFTTTVAGNADMWDLTVTTTHDFYIATASGSLLVHNCPTDNGNPQNNDTIHSTLRGGERTIEPSEVIKNAEHMYYDENGNQVYKWSQSGGHSQITIRNPANGNIVTNQLSSDPWIEQQIASGRWYDLQGE